MKTYFIYSIIERVLQTQEEFVLEASSETELNTMRVKAYRAVSDLRSKMPEVDSKIGISQDRKSLSLTIGPLKKPKIFIRQADGSLAPFELPNEGELRQIQRLLELMGRDKLSHAEILAALTPEQAVIAKGLLEEED